MKARLSNTGGADSKGLSAEMEAARKATAEASALMKADEQSRISAANKERRQSREQISGADAKELDPEVEAARPPGCRRREDASDGDMAQTEIDAQNKAMTR